MGMRHTNLRQRRIERGMTLYELSAATQLPVWVLGRAERQHRRGIAATRVRAAVAAVLIRIRVGPAS